jgi:hypothetical protein
MSQTLIRLRSRFDGDLDQYLIYMVFVLAELSRQLQERAGTGLVFYEAPRPTGLNALSVADITEIPRETVRRKLRLLVRSQHLKRDQNHLYYLSACTSAEDFLSDFEPLLRKFCLQP